MSLEEQLRKDLTEAMRAKDRRTSDVIRMISTKITERRTAKGFTGTVDDAMVTEVIAAYKKSLMKAREEYAALGDKGKDKIEELDWEIALTSRYLPQSMGEDELRGIVRAAIAELKITDPKMAGRLVGHVMKAHKGKADAADVKRIAEAELGGG